MKDFELFKSEICHEVKRLGETAFVTETIKSGIIRKTWDEGRYDEALYLLAMTDYLSKRCMMPLCGDYRDLRAQKLAEPLYPRDVILADKLCPEMKWKEKALNESIPEFLRYNIVEGDVFNVI